MNPASWKEMVDRTRELELALGSREKKIEANESETVILQRRAIHWAMNIEKGTNIQGSHLSMLRPCPEGAFSPYQQAEIIGRVLACDVVAGAVINMSDLE
jgi:N-acetylneuraminate synthase